MSKTTNGRFLRFAWGVLALNVIVIIWGAFVRATGSGAGCGSHWPLCNGEIIPRAEQVETLIEFSHRVSSGLALLAVVALVIWGFRAYPKGSLVRVGVTWTGIFMIVESLVGAALVLLNYTALNVSVARAIWMALHLTNTFLLLGALALTLWWANGGGGIQMRGQGSKGVTYWLLVAGMFLLGISGAITALGDTLTITGGISPQENALVQTLVDLRIFHPLIAFAVFGAALLAVWIAHRQGDMPAPALRYGQTILILFVVQLILGALNVQLHAPVWLQLVHLLLTTAIWLVIVWYGAALMAPRERDAGQAAAKLRDAAA
jgi:heme A synthase